MAFGLQSGDSVKELALRAGTLSTWQGIPVWAVVLLGGFTVNFLWCAFLNVKNRTGGDYVKSGTPLVANLFWAALAGFIWSLQTIFYSMADPQAGEYKVCRVDRPDVQHDRLQHHAGNHVWRVERR